MQGFEPLRAILCRPCRAMRSEGLADAAGVDFLRPSSWALISVSLQRTCASEQASNAMQPMSGFGQRDREEEATNTLTARLIASTVLSQSDGIAIDRVT